MRGALDVHRELLAHEVPHEIVHLRRLAAEADDLPAAGGLPPNATLAVRMVRLDADSGSSAEVISVLVAAAVPAGALLVMGNLLAALRHLNATAVRLPTAGEISAATDQIAGLVCPVGLPADIPVLVDQALTHEPVVYTPTGEGGTALGIRTPDLLALTRALVAPLATGLPAAAPRVRQPTSGASRLADHA